MQKIPVQCSVEKLKSEKKRIYQSGHRSVRFESSSGASFCFIQRSGIWNEEVEKISLKMESQTIKYQREISFHCAHESLSILLRCNNSRLASTSAQERSLLHPTLQLLVPCICSNVIYAYKLISKRKTKGTQTYRQFRLQARYCGCPPIQTVRLVNKKQLGNLHRKQGNSP